MEDNILEQLDFETPSQQRLREDLEEYDKPNVPEQIINATVANIVKLIKEEITLTPSIREVWEFLDKHFASEAVSDGWNLDAIAQTQAYVVAAFGFVGDELEQLNAEYNYEEPWREEDELKLVPFDSINWDSAFIVH